MRVCAALALVLLAAACGNAAGRLPAQLGGTVTYTRSGGMAGLYQQLRVDRQGRDRYTSLKPPRRRAFRVSAGDRSRLAEALRKADLAHLRIHRSAPVADAFHFTLAYRGHRLAFQQTDTPRRLRPLLTLLDRLIRRR